MGRRWVPFVVVIVGSLLGLAVAGLPSRRHDAPLRVQSASTSTGPAPAVSTSLPASTSSSAPALRPPSAVRVTPVNASSVPGSAGRVSTRLKSQGWNVQAPGADRKAQPASAVLYRSGFDGEARAVASALGVDPGTLKPLGAGSVLGDPDVAVVIGDDLAKRTS
jgi:hypothetical protein